MQTPALELAKHYRQNGLPERLRWGHVELKVTDLAKSICFWTTTLGLLDRGSTNGGGVQLGTRSQTLVTLLPGARAPVVAGHAGMYHVAIGVPNQKEFSRYLARLFDARIRLSTVDHTMSKAIYFNDPDGHGIEISLETPERFSVFVDMAHGFGMIDSKGQLRSGRDPLNVDDELRYAGDADFYGAIPDQCCIAHLHLHVPAIKPALQFFEQLGFVKNLHLHQIGFADLGTGGDYTHRLAVNIWQGQGVRAAPLENARLSGYTLQVSQAVLTTLKQSHPSAVSSNGDLNLVDPAGHVVTLSALPPASEYTAS